MGRYVMLLDDNPSDILVAQSVIESEGFVCISANDGYTALELLDNNEVHLFVIDLQMPKMSGIEFLKRIQSHSKAQGVPKLVMSARKQEKDVKLAITSGASDYITKPVNVESLKDKINKLILIDDSTEDWEELHLDPSRHNIKGQVAKPCALKAVCEIGGTLLSKAPMDIDSTQIVEFDILNAQGITARNLKVLNCEKKENLYFVKFSFIDMSDSDRQKLREFCCRETQLNEELEKKSVA